MDCFDDVQDMNVASIVSINECTSHRKCVNSRGKSFDSGHYFLVIRNLQILWTYCYRTSKPGFQPSIIKACKFKYVIRQVLLLIVRGDAGHFRHPEPRVRETDQDIGRRLPLQRQRWLIYLFSCGDVRRFHKKVLSYAFVLSLRVNQLKSVLCIKKKRKGTLRISYKLSNKAF